MVYKRILVIFIIVFMFGCSGALNAEEQPSVFEKQSVSVAIKPIKGSCSEIELSYYINLFNEVVRVPKSVVADEGFLFSSTVLSLTGKERLTMKINGNSESNELVAWNMDDSPYQAKVDLNKYFNLKKGQYYIQYLYSDAPYKAQLEDKAWIYSLIKSERYYIEFDENNCISDFLE